MKSVDINTLLEPTLDQLAEIAGYLWDRKWAEKNAGNMSVVVSSIIGNSIPEAGYKEFRLKETYRNIQGDFLIITGSGTRMRDLAKLPGENINLISIADDGSSYRLFESYFGGNSLLPSSELPTHLSIHNHLKEKGRTEKAVLHAHVTELIALTQNPDLKDEKCISELIWGMHPEAIMFLPEGIGFVPYTLPGTDSIARKTSDAIENKKILVWEKHGCFSIADNFLDAFDYMDIAAKAAGIYFMCRNAGFEPEGLSLEQIREIIKLHHKKDN